MFSDQLRVRHILPILLGGQFAAVVGVAAFILSPFALLSWGWFHQRVAGYGDAALMSGVAILSILYVTATFRVWWSRRSHLTKIEHRIILGLLVLASGVVVGMTNFAIYSVDRSAFIIGEVGREWAIQRSKTIKVEAARGAAFILWCNTVDRRLEAVTGDHFSFKGGAIARRVSNEYPIDVPLPGVEFRMIVARGSADFPGDVWSLEVREGDHKLLLNSLRHPGAGPFLKAPSEAGVTKDYLLAALRFRVALEEQRVMVLRQRAIQIVPPTAFVYHSMMGALGNEPGYLSPNVTASRVVALFQAVLKFLYAAVFLAIFVEKT